MADGRLFVVTSAYRMLCLRATDGATLWEADALGHERFATARFSFATDRAAQGAAVAVGDAVVFPGGRTLAAWDAATGRERWRIPCLDDCVPTPWRQGDRWRLLSFQGAVAEDAKRGRAAAPPALVAVDVADGEIVWRHPLELDPVGHGPALRGDRVAFLAADPATDGDLKYGGRIRLCSGSISGAGYTPAWCAPFPHGGGGINHRARPLITDKAVISSENDNGSAGTSGRKHAHGAALLAFDLRTGGLVRRLRGVAMGGNGHAVAVEDRLIVWRDNHHGHNDAWIVPRDIDRWPDSVDLDAVKPPHCTTSPCTDAPFVAPYADGRLFVRGADGVYADDLRSAAAR